MNNLKITIKEKEEIVKTPCLKDVQIGEVFKFIGGAGSLLLKIQQSKLIVVKTNSYNSMFDYYKSSDWSDTSLVQILGKLTEIVVDPNA